MIKKQKTNDTAYKTVWMTALITCIVGALVSIYTILKYNGLDNISSQFVWSFGISALLPFVVAAIAYATVKDDRHARWYKTAVITVATLALTGMATVLTMFFSFYLVSSNTTLWLITIQGIPLGAGFVALCCFVYATRNYDVIKKEQAMRKYFICGVLLFAVTTVLQDVYHIIMQWPYNQNLSGFSSNAIGYAIILLVFLFVYWREKRRNTADRWYVSLLIVSFAVMAAVTLSQLSWMLQTSSGVVPENQFVSGLYVILSSLAMIVATIVIRAKIRTIS